MGWDRHRLEAGRRLVLLGVEVDAEKGPVAHSDGDALAHALADAVLGAAGRGDIGAAFPDDAQETAGMPGPDLLGEAVSLAAEAGWRPVNADAHVRLETPRLAPHLASISSAAAAALGLDPARVRITARHGEGVGAVGRGEAVEAAAVVLMEPAPRPTARPDSGADPSRDKATVVRFDGGARGNPGPAAAAAVAYDGDRVLDTAVETMGVATNNEAEYRGFMLAVGLAGKWGAGQIEGDSKLVINQVLGEWKVKARSLAPLVAAARLAWQEEGSPDLVHTPRKGNKDADALLNEALDREG